MTDARPEGWIHRYPVTVQFDEVDAYGIVHHSKYFIYLERARVALLASLQKEAGADFDERFMVIVADAAVKYRTPSRFLDELVVETGTRRVGLSRLELAYAVRRGDALVCTADLVLAFVGPDGRPTRSPPELRAVLQAMGCPSQK